MLQFHYGEKSPLCAWIKRACLLLMDVRGHSQSVPLAPLLILACCYYCETAALTIWFMKSYLTVCIHHRSQQLPRAPPAVHAHHAQDLKESEAT